MTWVTLAGQWHWGTPPKQHREEAESCAPATTAWLHCSVLNRSISACPGKSLKLPAANEPAPPCKPFFPPEAAEAQGTDITEPLAGTHHGWKRKIDAIAAETPSQKAALNSSHPHSKQQNSHQASAKAADRETLAGHSQHIVCKSCESMAGSQERSTPCSLSNCVCTELLRGRETKVGDENNDAEGKQPAPLQGREQTENQMGRYGCCYVTGRGNEKTQSLFFWQNCFWAYFLGPLLAFM